MNNLKIVFMGTPDFAVPSLKMLIEQGYQVAACVTQPDRRAGRGRKMVPPPVKVMAEKYQIPVLQYRKISSEEGVLALRDLQPDLLITVAYGQILSDEVLHLAPHGCINVHASLLPAYRGSAPINWAVINGEKKTGITTMYTVKKLDAGDVLEQDEVEIAANMTAGELHDILAKVGANTLQRTLEKIKNNTLIRTPQVEEESSYFPMFKRGFGEIDFDKTMEEIHDFVRGTNPYPGAYMMYGDERVCVDVVSPYEMDAPDAKNGEVIAADDKVGLLVKASDGVLSLDEIQWQGARCMPAQECLRGRPIDTGYVFCTEDEE